jgi:hypothetical protein
MRLNGFASVTCAAKSAFEPLIAIAHHDLHPCAELPPRNFKRSLALFVEALEPTLFALRGSCNRLRSALSCQLAIFRFPRFEKCGYFIERPWARA